MVGGLFLMLFLPPSTSTEKSLWTSLILRWSRNSEAWKRRQYTSTTQLVTVVFHTVCHITVNVRKYQSPIPLRKSLGSSRSWAVSPFVSPSVLTWHWSGGKKEEKGPWVGFESRLSKFWRLLHLWGEQRGKMAKRPLIRRMQERPLRIWELDNQSVARKSTPWAKKHQLRNCSRFCRNSDFLKMSTEHLSPAPPGGVSSGRSRARRLSDALLQCDFGDKLAIPVANTTRRLSDALLQVVPNFPMASHSPVSKLAKVLSRNKHAQNSGNPVRSLLNQRMHI